MRKYITNFVKDCTECMRYKPPNQKLEGLLLTQTPSQRFEMLLIDLFGPLSVSHEKKWIYIVEDVTTKQDELFALENATTKECATILVKEVFKRYEISRRIICDKGLQFLSDIMQQLCYMIDIHQSLILVYHPPANPVEQKTRKINHAPRID